MTPSQAEQTPAAMIDRVSSLLGVFDGSRRLTLAQISRKAGLPRSSVHRILQRLVELGWVERHGFEYGLGLRIFEIGSLVVRQDGIRRVAVPFMQDLHLRTGLTVHLSVLRQTDILHIERIGGRPDDRDCWQVGARQPAQHTAAGRALLARLDPTELPDLDLSAPPTAYSVRSPAQLERELQKIRDYGVAVDVHGMVLGFASVATAIGPPGRSSAALSVTGPVSALKPDRLAAEIPATAASIWDAATAGRTRARSRSSVARAGAPRTGHQRTGDARHRR
ncbi:DNA-binding transcriptional regulator, IclR family [Thermomonospora echinospora]|uniref:DNA-binding transcriptional regulator, IclR family n=1 Tax=Thermomonospora echinospora TaxID=1992 RepID=A0A1H6E4L4_9ACTN|nr:IclR family transcriptional regulator [Thermomonospora echinospora]SEG92718.1 DNA-binding transcriptional regulator, IclR family [Thermomonospora echinospora]